MVLKIILKPDLLVFIDLKTNDPCAAKPVCEDIKDGDTCKRMADPNSLDYCRKHPGYMSNYCQKSCKNSLTNRMSDSKCNRYQSLGYCSKHFDAMRKYCKKACWIC